MDIELELQTLRKEIKILFIKNIEKLPNYIDRHKRILNTNIQVNKFDLILNKNSNEIIIPEQNLHTIRIIKENNDIQILIDVMPFTEFTIHNYFNSEMIVKRNDIDYLDNYFEINYFHIKIRLIPSVKQTVKKRYSWFNK